MTDLFRLARLAVVLLPICAAATTADAAVIYDATGGASNGGDPLSAAGPILADRFVTASATNLTSVTLNLSRVAGAAAGRFTIDLFADAGATGPGAATLLATVSDTVLSGAFQLLTFAPLSPITLAAGSYYIGIQDLLASSAILGNTLDAAVLARPAVAAGGVYFNNGGVQANAGGPYEIIINAVAVPEPAGWAALLGGVAMLALLQRRRADGAV